MKDTRSYIKDQKAQVEQSNNYNDYVQCIWYCVKGSDLEPIEIEIIKELTKDPKSLPLIIVYTKALNKKDVNKMKEKIKEKIGDIPFVPVLGRSVAGAMKSYGLDNLLNKTLEVCQNADKGDVLNKMKTIIVENVTNVFNKINSDIKIYNVNNNVYKFMNEFTKVLNEKELVNYIFTLLEQFLSEYMKFNKNEKKELSQKGKDNLKKSLSITNFIEEYIKVYQESTKNIVNPILETKAIKYLDIQVRIEKKEFKRSLNIENKCDKQDFIQVIESFLNDNFYYISQKYIIYHLIVDIFESFSEEVENQMNRIVKDILMINDAKEWFQNIYYKKFQGFKSNINNYRRNGKIYFKSIKIRCPNCKSRNVSLNATKERELIFLIIGNQTCLVQQFKCKKCGIKISTDLSSIVYKNSNITYPVIKHVLHLYGIFTGSLRKIQKSLKIEHKIDISHQAIENIILFSDFDFEIEPWSLSGYYIFDALWVKKNSKWKSFLNT